MLLELGPFHLEIKRIPATGSGLPELLFLHEGLGSVDLWKTFPEQLAQATGCGAWIYSRLGHGKSSPRQEAHEPDFMHREATEVLPRLRDKLGLENPVLVGHSDGASIALIHGYSLNFSNINERSHWFPAS